VLTNVPGIKDGEVLYECLTCMRKYVDVTPAPCSKCLPIVATDHDSTHTFISILFKEVEEVDNDACIVKCLDCNQGTVRSEFPIAVLSQMLIFRRTERLRYKYYIST
jgi:hypothetical protein